MEQHLPIQTDFSQEVRIAELAARQAGDYLVGKLGSARVEYQKAPRDDMLDVDLEAERIILSLLRKHFPTYGILSEEAGKERGDSPHCWIVDPLDGSANFQHGSSIFAVSIALTVQGKTVAGVIYLPVRNEMFTAILGQGAMLNGQPIYSSQQRKVEESLIHVGEFERHGNEVNREQIRELTIVADSARRIRMTGTSCTDLVWIACGRADALIMHGGNPWDVKAGRVILEEAGGRVSFRIYESGNVLTIYTNAPIHQELANLLGIGEQKQ